MTVDELAATILAQTQDRLRAAYPNSPQWSWEAVEVIPGPKYTKINRGPAHNMSGMLMIENATGQIYGIKGYGKVHKGHYYGTLDTTSEYDWADYYPRKMDEVEQAAAEIATEVASAARGSGDDPIAWVTGNQYMPPLRSFAAAERIYQADEDGEDFARLAELVDQKLDRAGVTVECPDYDNALYAVDLRRFEYEEDPDGETLQADWKPRNQPADTCQECGCTHGRDS